MQCVSSSAQIFRVGVSTFWTLDVLPVKFREHSMNRKIGRIKEILLKKTATLDSRFLLFRRCSFRRAKYFGTVNKVAFPIKIGFNPYSRVDNIYC